MDDPNKDAYGEHSRTECTHGISLLEPCSYCPSNSWPKRVLAAAAPRPQEPRNFSDFDCGGCGDGGCIQCCPSNFTEKALIEEMDELREAIKTSQEPSGELISAIESLLEWVPKSGKGSSGYLRVERVKAALKFFSPAQSPQPPKLMVGRYGDIHEACPDCRGVCSEYKPPAQSQGAAPLCGKCGTILTPTGLTRPGQPKFQCLSCGATTSCTEGEKL